MNIIYNSVLLFCQAFCTQLRVRLGSLRACQRCDSHRRTDTRGLARHKARTQWGLTREPESDGSSYYNARQIAGGRDFMLILSNASSIGWQTTNVSASAPHTQSTPQDTWPITVDLTRWYPISNKQRVSRDTCTDQSMFIATVNILQISWFGSLPK